MGAQPTKEAGEGPENGTGAATAKKGFSGNIMEELNSMSHDEELFQRIIGISQKLYRHYNEHFLNENFCKSLATIYQKRLLQLDVETLRQIHNAMNGNGNGNGNGNRNGNRKFQAVLAYQPSEDEKFMVNEFKAELKEYLWNHDVEYNPQIYTALGIPDEKIPIKIIDPQNRLRYIDVGHVNELLSTPLNNGNTVGNAAGNVAVNAAANASFTGGARYNRNRGNSSSSYPNNNNSTGSSRSLSSSVSRSASSLPFNRNSGTGRNFGNRSDNRGGNRRDNRRSNGNNSGNLGFAENENVLGNVNGNVDDSLQPSADLQSASALSGQDGRPKKVLGNGNKNRNMPRESSGPVKIRPNMNRSNIKRLKEKLEQASKEFGGLGNHMENAKNKVQVNRANAATGNVTTTTTRNRRSNNNNELIQFLDQIPNQPGNRGNRGNLTNLLFPMGEKNGNGKSGNGKSGNGKRLIFSARGYNKPTNLCSGGNGANGSGCKMTKSQLCRAITDHFMVRGNIIAAILSTLPRKSGKGFEGGFCYQRFLNLDKCQVCLPHNYDELMTMDPKTRIQTMMLFINYMTEKECNAANGLFRKLTLPEKKSLIENARRGERFNRLYSEYTQNVRHKYMEHLNQLLEILNLLSTMEEINNEQLNQLAMKTKETIDSMYHLCQFYYLYAIIALLNANIKPAENEKSKAQNEVASNMESFIR
jgi:hypothetical protein